MLDNVQYMPTRGRYKVYLIDEVHMLSTSSFNALLKTLEEPPPYVKFLLATTDPQKLPATVLSRCLQFSLKNMPPEPIVGHLQNVLTSENIPFEDDALWLLGRAADGSMRDAMSLTDQAVSFGDGSVLADDVRAMLGTLDQGQIYGVLKALIAGDARAALSAVAHLAEHGPDWAGVLAEILNALHRIAIAQLMPDAIDNGQGDREQVLELAAIVPAEDVQFYYQLGLIGRRDLPLAPDPRDGFEMVLLRMLAFRPASLPGTPPTTTLVQPEPANSAADGQNTTAQATTTASRSLAQQPALPDTPVASSSQAQVDTVVAESASASENPVTPNAVPVDQAPVAAPAEEIHAPWEEQPDSVAIEPPTVAAQPVASSAQDPALTAPASRPATASADAQASTTQQSAAVAQAEQPEHAAYYDDAYSQALADEAGDDEDEYLASSHYQDYAELPSFSDDEPVQLHGNNVDLQPNIAPASGQAAEWQTLFAQLNLAGMTHSIAANTVLVEKNADVWLLHLDPNHSALFNKTQLQRINEAINTHLGAPIELQIELHTPTEETPALALLRKQAKRQQEAEAAIHTDPVVLQLMDTFGATISADSIEPIDSL